MRQGRGSWFRPFVGCAAVLLLLGPSCGSDEVAPDGTAERPLRGAAPELATPEEVAPTGAELAPTAEDHAATELSTPALGPGDVAASRVVRLPAVAPPLTELGAESETGEREATVVPDASVVGGRVEVTDPTVVPDLALVPDPTVVPDPTAVPVPDRTPGPASTPGAELEPLAERPPTVALQHIDVRGEIVGNVAEIEVEQLFANTYGERLEAIYVFPLPTDAAVRDMVMVVGERRIRADLMQRDAAVETYEAARDQGRTASLLEQERPNIFTMSVANLEPGVPIRVLVRYVEQLRYADGRYHFAFPTVVGPRFIPGEPTGREGEGALPDTDRVPDASRLTPAVLPEGEPTPYTVNFSVDLFAGMAIEELASASVDFDASWATEHAVRVALPPEGRQPNRDLAFTYALAGDEPATGVLSHLDERGGFFSLMVEPPSVLVPSDVRPKEIVFVIDMSGSMRGQPLDAAKGVIRHALRHLNPDDTFQILRFSETASGFAPAPVASTPANVAAGLAFVEDLSAGGGTQMIEGIRAALGPEADPERMRVVLFLTDGFIGNESEILAEVDRLVGGARLFSLGVGSSVNRFLLEKLADVGRGTVHYVDIGEDPTEAVEAFYRRVQNPVLTDLEIDWGGLEVSEVTPERIPDVFDGTPLLVSGRYASPGEGTVTVRGRLGREPVELLVDVSLGGDGDHPALPYLWARRQIDALERRAAWAPDEALRGQVVELSLEYRVLTQYTAFVAVDERVSADVSDPLRTVGTPVALPEGVSGAAIGPQMIDWAAPDDDSGETASRGARPSRRAHGVGGGGSAPVAQAFGRVEAQGEGFGRGMAGTPGGSTSQLRERRVSAPRLMAAQPSVEREESRPIDRDAGLSYVELAGVVGAEQRDLEACVAPADWEGDLVLTLRIEVDPDGSVASVEVRGADDLEEPVVDCLRELVRGLRFPSFQGDRVRFQYTLRLPAP